MKALSYLCLTLILLTAFQSKNVQAQFSQFIPDPCCEIITYSDNNSISWFYKTNRLNQQPVQEPVEDASGFWNALMGGDFDLNNRFRSEIVQMDGLRDARAITNRIQLGYGTLPFYGFAGYIDFVDVRPIGAVRYNAAGLNNQPNRALVPDPRLTVLNQMYGQFAYDPYDAILKIGRQRIIHHNARFIGNVGWRQNEQTFDAITARSSLGIDNLELEYNYLWQANRVLGPTHPMGIFKSRSHLGHVTYNDFLAGGKLTGFIYLLDFETAPEFSSQTIGLRTDGGFGLIDDFRINYAGSFARQTDAGEHPVNYGANYFLFDINLENEIWGKLGGAFEVLSTDDGEAAFQTPLATLHTYQGWADVFLTTPDNGLEDLSIYGETVLPGDISTILKYHWFYFNEQGGLIGQEFNISFHKQINEYLGLMLKLADFRGKNGFTDRRKFWFQTEISF